VQTARDGIEILMRGMNIFYCISGHA